MVLLKEESPAPPLQAEGWRQLQMQGPSGRFGPVRQPRILKLYFHSIFKFNRGRRISARR
jgi:hypothetical protein